MALASMVRKGDGGRAKHKEEKGLERGYDDKVGIGRQGQAGASAGDRR